MLVRLVACVLSVLAMGESGWAASPDGIANPSFEEASSDARPLPGWAVGGEAYSCERVLSRPVRGEAAARLSFTGAEKGAAKFGTLVQKIPAEAYRGRRVRLRAMVRTDGAKAGLWLRADAAPGKPLAFASLADRPITATEWTRAEVLGDVPVEATSVALGLILYGAGEAFVDEVTLEDLGPVGLGAEPARPMSGRGADNLAAFARAYGYVRFFYPGEAAAGVDWNTVALAGVQQVEGATSPADLAKRMEAVFGAFAPEFRAWPTKGVAPTAEPIAAGPGLRWRHEGVGIGTNKLYTSKLVPAEAGLAADLFTADLPGGVTLRLPLVTTKERPAVAALAPILAKPEGFTPVGDDRTTRVAAVIIAWNVFQHFYPYFDTVGVDWPGELKPALGKAATAPDAIAFREVLERLTAALADGHGGVSGPGAPTGVLPVAWEWIESRLVVLAAGRDTGLTVGDVVTTIDGQEVAALLAERETLIASATPQWKRWRSTQALRTGPADSKVELRGVRGDGSAFQVRLTRKGDAEAYAVRSAKPEPLSDLAPGVVYVDLDRISDEELTAALPRLATAKGVIFDLRGYPQRPSSRILRHLSDQTVRSAEWNVPVALRPDRQDVTWKASRWTLTPEAPRIAGKVVFVTDGRAISKAESFLGVIEGARLAPIVGETSAGTNGDINPFSLPGGYSLTWTGLKVLKQDGSPHHGVGIRPTVEVHRTLLGVRAGRDEQLEVALAIVQSGS